ncbi:MAG TPA: hypothetical protein VKR30_10500 [Candidatus Limnocylindrales bacterium]|nr:hypothetical protein [Candidatus Limnocylindrales bacterium]
MSLEAIDDVAGEVQEPDRDGADRAIEEDQRLGVILVGESAAVMGAS